MKNLIFAAALATSFTASAQITLEKSYTSNNRMSLEKIENDGYKYVGIEESSKKIVIYSEDHTIWKRINTNIPQTATIYTLPTYASRTLFNADNDIELLVMYLDAGIFTIELYNEKGTSLFSVSSAAYYELKKLDEEWKLLIHKNSTPQHTEVYSLPGKYMGVQKIEGDGLETSAFPNPANDVTNIQYSLPSGITAATVQLFNANGVLMQSYPISQNSGSLLINRAGYPAGVYSYTINVAGQAQQSNKIIFQ